MNSLYWNSGLDTGVVEIDVQHREMMELINALQRVAEQRRSAPHVGDGMLAPLFCVDSPAQPQTLEAMDQFIEATLHHFSFEEAVMDHLDHPASPEHCASHQAFRVYMLDVREKFISGNDVLDDFVMLLRKWLPKHIANDEEEFTDLVRDPEVSESPNPEIHLSSGNMFEDILLEPARPLH